MTTVPTADPAPEPLAISSCYIVELSCNVDFEDLEPEDLDEGGECLRDGAYRVTLTGATLSRRDALGRVRDIFDEVAEIHSEDAYTTLIRPATAQEALQDASAFRADLGEFPAIPVDGTDPAHDWLER